MATLADLLWLAYRAPHYSVRGCFFPAAQQMALIKEKQALTEQCGTIQSLTEPLLVCLVFLRPATVSQPKWPCQTLSIARRGPPLGVIG